MERAISHQPSAVGFQPNRGFAELSRKWPKTGRFLGKQKYGKVRSPLRLAAASWKA
jgi:hypothetical protein